MRLLPLLLGLSLALPSAATAQKSADEKAALAVVQDLFKGMRTKDTALMRSVFESGARLTGIRTRQDGTTILQTIPAEQFIARVAGDPRPDWTERPFNPKIQIEGTLGHVWVDYDFHFGQTFSHCGVDSFQLLKLNGKWLIVAIADTFQKDGCKDRGKP